MTQGQCIPLDNLHTPLVAGRVVTALGALVPNQDAVSIRGAKGVDVTASVTVRAEGGIGNGKNLNVVGHSPILSEETWPIHTRLRV